MKFFNFTTTALTSISIAHSAAVSGIPPRFYRQEIKEQLVVMVHVEERNDHLAQYVSPCGRPLIQNTASLSHASLKHRLDSQPDISYVYPNYPPISTNYERVGARNRPSSSSISSTLVFSPTNTNYPSTTTPATVSTLMSTIFNTTYL